MLTQGARAGRALALAALLTAAWGATALAHAYIERATPADGSAMSASPAEVRLVYTEPVEPGLSSVVLVDSRGRPVPGTRLESEGRLTLVLRLPPLAEGPYTVRARVLGADGHVTEETVSFYVGNPPPDWKAAAPGQGSPAVGSDAGTAVAALLLVALLGVGGYLIARAARPRR